MSSSYYNAYYYHHCCGESWHNEQAWTVFFTDVAEHIVRDIRPATVMDAGCGLGLLVQLLRQRGIAAEGIDISEYAIQNGFPKAKDWCHLGSILDPFPRQYDLILCIEVIEHLPPEQAVPAIANLCQHSQDILFSSSPFDYKETTHLNVQPPEYWAGLFAQHQFYRDVDFDASFVSHWAVRFRYMNEPFERIVRNYERKFFPLWKENIDLRSQALELQQKLARMEHLDVP